MCLLQSRFIFYNKNADFNITINFFLSQIFILVVYLDIRLKLNLKPHINLKTKAKSRDKRLIRMKFSSFVLFSLFFVLLNSMCITGKAGHLYHSATKFSFMCHKLKICFRTKSEKPEKNKPEKNQSSSSNLALADLKEILDSQPGILQIIGKP